MYISTPHGPREGLQRYQDHIDHHLFSFDPNDATFMTNRTGSHRYPTKSFFDSLPSARFDCIWFLFPPLVMNWDMRQNPGYGIYTAQGIVGGTSATHLQVPPYKIQDRANNVFPIIIKLWNFWQRGRLCFGFSELSGSIWLFFNNNASLAPPPWFNITLSLMIIALQYLQLFCS